MKESLEKEWLVSNYPILFFVAENAEPLLKLLFSVPVVPILQLQNFLDEFQGHITELTHFQATLGPKIPDYLNKNQ